MSYMHIVDLTLLKQSCSSDAIFTFTVKNTADNTMVSIGHSQTAIANIASINDRQVFVYYMVNM